MNQNPDLEEDPSHASANGVSHQALRSNVRDVSQGRGIDSGDAAEHVSPMDDRLARRLCRPNPESWVAVDRTVPAVLQGMDGSNRGSDPQESGHLRTPIQGRLGIAG